MIVVGAGLAGLSVASELAEVEKVLLVDEKPTDYNRRQADAKYCDPHETLLPYVEEQGLTEAILQTFDTMEIQTATETYQFKTSVAHCTLDYNKLRQIIRRKARGEFLQGSVTEATTQSITVDGKIFWSRVLVDASGWSAAVASRIQPGYADEKKLTPIIATLVDYHLEHVIYFVEPAEKTGGFIVPLGEKAFAGIGSHAGRTDLEPVLAKVLSEKGLSPGVVTHGFIPCHGLREPTVAEKVFVVGDAAGQSKPIRGKGILRSTLYGRKCGQLIREVLNGQKTLNTALEEYRDYVYEEKFIYDLLYLVQRSMVSLPSWVSSFGTAITANRLFAGLFDRMY